MILFKETADVTSIAKKLQTCGKDLGLGNFQDLLLVGHY